MQVFTAENSKFLTHGGVYGFLVGGDVYLDNLSLTSYLGRHNHNSAETETVDVRVSKEQRDSYFTNENYRTGPRRVILLSVFLGNKTNRRLLTGEQKSILNYFIKLQQGIVKLDNSAYIKSKLCGISKRLDAALQELLSIKAELNELKY